VAFNLINDREAINHNFPFFIFHFPLQNKGAAEDFAAAPLAKILLTTPIVRE